MSCKFNSLLFSVLFIFSISNSRADSVDYILDNVVMTNSLTITGIFTWTYPTGDFENGSGTFSDLTIPGYGSDLTGLNITIDLTSIEFSLKANLDNKSLDIVLRLLTPLLPTQSSVMDISQDSLGNYASKYDLIGYVGYTGAVGGFTSGSITPLPTMLGDLNSDSNINVADLVIAMNIIINDNPPSAVQFYALDVAPLINGASTPDGVLNAADLLLLSRKILGQVNF
ncbi:hypothetical protein MNBD_GAMMA05-2544 [hydrothermal vent metagenome]|uniref:Dockerin domain-containing protein n=1 Tax=hydrothermal vent metagenome TaxID=652676 RepID=A0A3B0WEW0_9ZZZZ